MSDEPDQYVKHTHEQISKDASFLTEILLSSINYSIQIRSNSPLVSINDCLTHGITAMKNMKKLEIERDIWR